jgi:hypothetical protein
MYNYLNPTPQSKYTAYAIQTLCAIFGLSYIQNSIIEVSNLSLFPPNPFLGDKPDAVCDGGR